MKPFILFALSFSFAITEVIAGNTAKNNSSTSPPAAPASKGNAPPAARPGTGVRNPGVNAGKARFGIPAANLRGNYPTVQSLQRGSLALNTAQFPRNYQPRQNIDLAVPGQQVGTVRGKPAGNGANNPQRTHNNRNSFADAVKRCRHEHHDCNWWRHHCRTIVFVNTGYYYLDAGYWYPAYGYDSAYNYYDYDGPIYTYGELLPDQVIANVQQALREAGYYVGQITGSLGPATRAALANFQRDYGLVITGAVDEPTVQTLGLN
jgi:putative peptidoglycan binding protein